MKQILSFLMTALAPITGMAQDFNGGWTFRSNTQSKADAPLHLQVEGADLLGFGSARPRSSENFLSGTYTPYYGHAQAVLRASKAGPVTLRVSSDKYPEAVCQIDIR